MKLFQLRTKNPMEQAHKPLVFDFAPVPGLILVMLFAASAAFFNILGFRETYSGTMGDALTWLAVLCELGAFAFGIYLVWRVRRNVPAGATLFVAWLICSAVNVFGGVQSLQIEMRPIEAARQARASFEHRVLWDAAQKRVDELAALLPALCPNDKGPLAQQECGSNYNLAYAAAEKRGDVRRYNEAADALAAIPPRPVVKPLIPDWAPWVIFSGIALISLVGPWMVGFGRPAQDGFKAEDQNTEAPEVGPPPSDLAPPAVAQNAPQTATPTIRDSRIVQPNPWPPEGYIQGGAQSAIVGETPEDRVRSALQIPNADGKLPSVNEVAKAFAPEVKRWRVQAIAAELKGRAA